LGLPDRRLSCLPLDDAVLQASAAVHSSALLDQLTARGAVLGGTSALHPLLDRLYLPLGAGTLLKHPRLLLRPGALLEHLRLLLRPGALLDRLHLLLRPGALLKLSSLLCGLTRLLLRRLPLLLLLLRLLLASATAGRGPGLRCLRLLGGLVPVVAPALGLGRSRDGQRRYGRDQNPLGHNIFPAMLHIWTEISKNRMITI